MTARDLLLQLHELGVVMTSSPDGTVRCRAPRGVLTPALLDTMREHKVELHILVEEFEARAALMEYDGGVPRGEAARRAWDWLFQKEADAQPASAPSHASRGETPARPSTAPGGDHPDSPAGVVAEGQTHSEPSAPSAHVANLEVI